MEEKIYQIETGLTAIYHIAYSLYASNSCCQKETEERKVFFSQINHLIKKKEESSHLLKTYRQLVNEDKTDGFYLYLKDEILYCKDIITRLTKEYYRVNINPKDISDEINKLIQYLDDLYTI